MRFVGGPRKEIKIPTVFNILGPLANPAKANLQLLGVYDKSLVEPLARVLSNLGVKRGMVVHGDDGLDEISAVTTTTICEFNNGTFETYSFNPEAYGFTLCAKEELTGGTPEENAQITKRHFIRQHQRWKADCCFIKCRSRLYILQTRFLWKKASGWLPILWTAAPLLQKLEAFIAATNA